MALPDGWCIYYTLNLTKGDQAYYAAVAIPVLFCSLAIMLCLTIVGFKVRNFSQVRNYPSSSKKSLIDREAEDETTALIIQNQWGNDPNRRQMSVARSIVNNILVTFLLCYSAAIYIDFRLLLMALGGNHYNYEYVSFDDPDGPPNFNEISLIIFRLKFSLTIIFSIINPILVFRGSSIFRSNIGELFVVDDFSYVVSNRQ